jgi:hypothetical protein
MRLAAAQLNELLICKDRPQPPGASPLLLADRYGHSFSKARALDIYASGCNSVWDSDTPAGPSEDFITLLHSGKLGDLH